MIGLIIVIVFFGGLLLYGWAIWKPGRPLYEHGVRCNRRIAQNAVEKAEQYGEVMSSLARKQLTTAGWNDFLDELVGELVIHSRVTSDA